MAATMFLRKSPGRLILCAAALLLLLVSAGCGNPRSFFEPMVYAGRGGWSPSTEFEVFRISIDDSIRRELAGEKLGLQPALTWKAFWQGRYEEIRSVDDPATAERNIAYIYQQRRRFRACSQ